MILYRPFPFSTCMLVSSYREKHVRSGLGEQFHSTCCFSAVCHPKPRVSVFVHVQE